MTTLLLFSTIVIPQVGAATIDFSVLDNSSDVVKYMIENGSLKDWENDPTEQSIDFVEIAAEFSTAPTENSTFVLTFSGVPQVDDRHLYWVLFSGTAYMANNDTHYLGILIFVTITGMSNGSDSGASLTMHHALIPRDNPDDYYNPYFGFEVGIPIAYSLSTTALTASFNIHDISGPLFASAWSQVTSIDINPESPFQVDVGISAGFSAHACKTDVPNQHYEGISSGTMWWDFVPDEESSNVFSMVPSASNGELSTTVVENNTALSLPTSGFTVTNMLLASFPLIVLFVARKVHVTRKKK